MATASINPTSRADEKAFSEKFAHWIALYGAYLFVAGWTYLYYYLDIFGVNSRWLEIGVNETIMQGFAVLFGDGVWLSLVYLGVLVISLILEIVLSGRNRLVEIIAAICLIGLLLPTYWVAKNAGIDRANADRSDKSTLPTVVFTEKQCAYHGKLLYAKGDYFYVYDIAGLPPDTEREKPQSCPINLRATGASFVPQLYLVRTSDLSDVRIIHYEKEAKR